MDQFPFDHVFIKYSKNLVSRIADLLYYNNVISPSQFRFRPNHSTDHTIVDVISSYYDKLKKVAFSYPVV